MDFFKKLFYRKEKHSSPSPKIMIKEKDGIEISFDVSNSNMPKPLNAKIKFNVLGEELIVDYDFSDAANEERKKKRELDRLLAWTKGSGDRLSMAEQELIGEGIYAYKKFSENYLFCIVFQKELIKSESINTGKFWLIDCVKKSIVYKKDTKIIDSCFVLDCGKVVYSEYTRESIINELVCLDKMGNMEFNVRKKVGISIDFVTNAGVIKGNFLDKRHSEFEYKI